MSAFTQGLQFGLLQGMYNNMFGFCGFGGFGGFWGNPFGCFNNFGFMGGGFFGYSPFNFFSTPMFNMPNLMGSCFYQYPYPQSQLPAVFNSIFAQPQPLLLINSLPSASSSDKDGSESKDKEESKISSGSNTVTKPEKTEEASTPSTVTRPESTQTQSSSGTSTQPGSTRTSLANKKWYEMTDAELRSIYGNYSRDITKLYKGTAKDLNSYLKDKGVLKDKGQAFIDAQNRYGISASALVGICMNESAKGSSSLAKTKNNVGGIRISGSNEFRKFDKVEDCIDYMASLLKSGYVNNSTRPLTKLYEINARYCPVSDPTDTKNTNGNWARNVDIYISEVENALV